MNLEAVVTPQQSIWPWEIRNMGVGFKQIGVLPMAFCGPKPLLHRTKCNPQDQTMKLDRTDRRILQAMQTKGNISNLDLAEIVGLSPTPCSRRVKRLEESGIINGHACLLNQPMLGLKITAYIGISMDRHTPDRFEEFESKVSDFPEVMECSVVTGQSADYLLKAVVPDMEYYEKFLLGKLTRIPGVTGVHSSFELRRVVYKTALPLEHIHQQ
jgi:Lrp/AsnC family leucine-responsive transcriptional regulator